MPRQARLDAPGTLHHVMVLAGAGTGFDYMDFESRVWDCDGRNSEVVTGLHLGHRQGNSKNGGGGLKVLIFHYVPQSLTNSPRSHARSARTSFSFLTFWIS